MQLTQSTKYKDVAFVIQSTSIRMDDTTKTLAAMQGLTSYECGIIPFTNIITGIEDIPTDGILIPLGGTKLVQMYVDRQLPDNWLVFYNTTNFDQKHYVIALHDKLLNCDAQYMRLERVLDATYASDVFIKPTNDLKMFAGIVVPAGRSLREELAHTMHQELIEDSIVLVADTQPVLQEFRVVVSHGDIIGMNRYMENGNVNPWNIRNCAEVAQVTQFVADLHAIYQPADVYVIDICEVQNTLSLAPSLKVIEYNCFNASGLYTMDRNMIYKRIAKDVINQATMELGE